MKKERKVLDAFCKKLVACDMDIFGLRKKDVAKDEEKWVTVHPGGKGMKSDGSGMKGGTHVLIEETTGEVKAGMGGKHNGETISEIKQESNNGNQSAAAPSKSTSPTSIGTNIESIKTQDPAPTSTEEKHYDFFEDTPEYKELYDKKQKAEDISGQEYDKLQDIKDKIFAAKNSPDFQSQKESLDKELKAAEAKYTAATNEWYNLETQIVNAKKSWMQKNANSLPTNKPYETPKGKMSPIPDNLPEDSSFVKYLEQKNFVTSDNPTEYDAAGWGKQKFSQKEIPSEQSLKQTGFYSNDGAPEGYWNGVPHVQKPHSGLQPIGDKPVMECINYNKKGDMDAYREQAHNNVPFASQYNSAAGQAAARSYCACSNTLNATLRDGIDKDTGSYTSAIKKEWSADTALVTKELDKMFSVSKAKEPMTVYRGIKHLPLEAFNSQYSMGNVIEEKGFMSTSVDINKAKNFAGTNYGLIKIRVPAGASAMSMRYNAKDKTDFSAFAGEDEILLPRNTKYKIVGYEKGKGKLSKYKKIPIVEIVEE
jgi:hypothetical protein